MEQIQRHRSSIESNALLDRQNSKGILRALTKEVQKEIRKSSLNNEAKEFQIKKQELEEKVNKKLQLIEEMPKENCFLQIRRQKMIDSLSKLSNSSAITSQINEILTSLGNSFSTPEQEPEESSQKDKGKFYKAEDFAAPPTHPLDKLTIFLLCLVALLSLLDNEFFLANLSQKKEPIISLDLIALKATSGQISVRLTSMIVNIIIICICSLRRFKHGKPNLILEVTSILINPLVSNFTSEVVIAEQPNLIFWNLWVNFFCLFKSTSLIVLFNDNSLYNSYAANDILSKNYVRNSFFLRIRLLIFKNFRLYTLSFFALSSFFGTLAFRYSFVLTNTDGFYSAHDNVLSSFLLFADAYLRLGSVTLSDSFTGRIVVLITSLAGTMFFGKLVQFSTNWSLMDSNERDAFFNINEIKSKAKVNKISVSIVKSIVLLNKLKKTHDITAIFVTCANIKMHIRCMNREFTKLGVIAGNFEKETFKMISNSKVSMKVLQETSNDLHSSFYKLDNLKIVSKNINKKLLELIGSLRSFTKDLVSKL